MKISFIKYYIAIRDGEKGASAAEYAILVTLIAGVIIGAVAFFGTRVAGLFQLIVDSWP